MILYINGDSHAAAAEAVNNHAFANDSSQYFYMGRAPHPDNWQASWGQLLGLKIKATVHCDAESAASNQRILRTTKNWVNNNEAILPRALIVIGWSTWEREEWLIDNTYYQINASGDDWLPASHVEKYKQFVASVDWKFKTQQAHNDIWQLHLLFQDKNIKHLFFNCNNDFSIIEDRKDWNHCYLDPYDSQSTYHSLLTTAGFETVSPQSWHFGSAAHAWWSSYMLKQLIARRMI